MTSGQCQDGDVGHFAAGTTCGRQDNEFFFLPQIFFRKERVRIAAHRGYGKQFGDVYDRTSADGNDPAKGACGGRGQ